MRKLRVHLLRLVFVPIILIAVFGRPSWAPESPTAVAMELGGYLVLVAGLAIRIWSSIYICSRKSNDIIAEGPYSVCRNPLYVGSFLLAIGVGLCFENLLVLLLVPTIIIPAHILTVRWEEAHLESKFGERYRLYKQKVPRFWPCLSNYSSPDVINVNVNSIRRIAMDTLAVMLIPAIEDLLEVLHKNGCIPVQPFLQ